MTDWPIAKRLSSSPFTCIGYRYRPSPLLSPIPFRLYPLPQYAHRKPQCRFCFHLPPWAAIQPETMPPPLVGYLVPTLLYGLIHLLSSSHWSLFPTDTYNILHSAVVRAYYHPSRSCVTSSCRILGCHTVTATSNYEQNSDHVLNNKSGVSIISTPNLC